MRHGTSGRRPRNRNSNSNSNGRRSGGNGNQQRTQVYDSNGPDVRIRGTANQVAEKYLALAKDATSAGDRIIAESYYQHAEHYIRLVNEYNGNFESSRVARDNAEDIAEDEGNRAHSNKVDNEVEDLSLPASILGVSSVAKEGARQSEAVE